ncbi:acetylornithine deacetylase [Albidovulum inexpectatum]|uniref:Acetylornithine deacetylase n=1 Tax=Albidovulum inexpectatum TaxID=196587 RepID=A0A2S5JH70_9RHOB|nr:acetylornithine deacetylase [Albidovulum inexpectatum]PPB80854.1 acetylornithine deacetylase [Albidovulum inexpectatum]
MTLPVEDTIAILADLVAFPTFPGQPNLDFVGHVCALLERAGVTYTLDHDESGQRANLFATIGPAVDGGVALSGHTDVVPVEGQAWTLPPFRLTRRRDRLHGRGAVDMKGFLACVLAMVPRMAALPLQRPIHLALSYDEEPGSLGAPGLARHILATGPVPAAVIVGEPTRMVPVAGHKGGIEFQTTFRGVAGHSSDPARGVSAIHHAAGFITFLQELAARMAAEAPADSPFRPPCNTINVGTIHGGAGRSIIAEDCTLDWELRLTPPDDGAWALSRITAWLDATRARMRARDPRAGIETLTVSHYPGLAVAPDSPAARLVAELTGMTPRATVPFGTDAGCFQRAGLSAIVMGPGDIAEAHRPDEFIEIDQIAACLAFLDRLCVWACTGA